MNARGRLSGGRPRLYRLRGKVCIALPLPFMA
ncbi:putative protein OS=Sphingobium scionense OX=1404341 GN=GGQ90_002565 PE=4 SV=1 [Sphingobium scionense]|uniref:Uncharacterized protein n=1 Tax=Sphingobium scionense TaxID=1404341 RepID=A0A7W6LSX6_9SPHN|nr:hypothetical protein [Sphingobium scionense]